MHNPPNSKIFPSFMMVQSLWPDSGWPLIKAQIFTMQLFSVLIMNTSTQPPNYQHFWDANFGLGKFDLLFCSHATIFLFSSTNGFEGEGGRSRRSLASVSGDINHYEDPDKFQHPPNITPVGGVPNLKVGTIIKVIRSDISIIWICACY